MTLLLSLIICSHNPRADYLQRVLTALQGQTFAVNQWELLLIDNASDRPLAQAIDLTWHPQARCVREEQLGLTPARLRGIQEAQAETLIFVDDDNVLDPDYLAAAWEISQNYPFLGAWGGRILPEFEESPPEWTRPYWISLALREFEDDRWSNLVNQYETTPCGAGMCIRKMIAERYATSVQQDSRRKKMGRQGQNLTSYEDSDMAFTACDMGYGTGRFKRLKLTHLMPPARLQEDYLLRLVEASSFSGTIVESYRSPISNPQKSLPGRLADGYRFWRMSARERRFQQARQRGFDAALRELTTIS
jgi:glycosyltransferase involved in cell wall biosynthesis